MRVDQGRAVAELVGVEVGLLDGGGGEGWVELEGVDDWGEGYGGVCGADLFEGLFESGGVG